MAIIDMPSIVDVGHSHSTYSLANLAQPTSTYLGSTRGLGFGGESLAVADTAFAALNRNFSERRLQAAAAFPQAEAIAKEQPMATPSRRLIQVFIADPDEKVPLEQSLLYTGEQKLTDLTDQELFFEIDIKSILSTHNSKRTKIIDKTIKDRTQHLEPVKVRDLKMVVVNVATF